MPHWQVYDGPLLQEAVTAPGRGGRRAQLALDGLRCSACVARVERTLEGLARDVRVSLANGTVDFELDPGTPLSTIAERLEQAGFSPQVLAQDRSALAAAAGRRRALARVGVALLCSMQVMMLAWPTYFDTAALDDGSAALLRWAQWVLATPALLYSGWPFLDGAWRSLRARTLGMDVPIAASLLVAYLVSAARTFQGSGELYFDAVTMFVLLLGAGRYLEGQTRARAAERLRLLAARRALTATRLDDAGAQEVPITALAAGDRVRVSPGEAVPVDGTLLEASADLDESLLTGEARPVRRAPGETLAGGSLNVGAQALQLRATATGAQSRIAQIERTLHEAGLTRPTQRLLTDRIAGAFVVAVLVLAAGGAALWWPHDPERAIGVLLAVLVASCPCALSLAIPAVHAAASAKLAAAGVLLARPEALGRACAVDTALFDKTGTLTSPEFRLMRLHLLSGRGTAECLALAAALESGLSHPLARAFHDEAVAPALDAHLRGDGIEGRVGTAVYRMVAAVPGRDPGVDAILGAADAGLSWVQLEQHGRVLALFGLGAPAREDAAATVAALGRRGMRVEILSGDGPGAVAALAGQTGVALHHARQSPAQKLERLQALRRSGHVVMAVGDGVNDAPFLAAADVAVAMPHATALAQARADAILTGESLHGLLVLLDVARQARRRIRQNVAWSVGYNLSIMPLALAGVLSPWVAALGMSVSSLLVVANALRVGPRG